MSVEREEERWEREGRMTPPHVLPEGVLSDLREVQGAVFGHGPGDEPDVYADYDRLCELWRKMRAAIVALDAIDHGAPAVQSGEVGWRSFQARVSDWMVACFPPVVCMDEVERSDRFIEESLELVQARGYSAERAHALVDYVFGRPAGDPPQEVGGVMVTLAALCHVARISMTDAAEVELERINRPEIIEKIRAKQAAKPTGSALPVALQSPSGWRPSPEAVARLIAPEDWAFHDRHEANPVMATQIKIQTRHSLAKADAILALPPVEGE